MARYIDADALIAKWEEDIKHIPNASFRAMMQGAINEVSNAPTADVVEVVRCRDCIHAKQHGYAPAECQWYCTASLQYHSDRFFCACGERRME